MGKCIASELKYLLLFAISNMIRLMFIFFKQNYVILLAKSLNIAYQCCEWNSMNLIGSLQL